MSYFLNHSQAFQVMRKEKAITSRLNPDESRNYSYVVARIFVYQHLQLCVLELFHGSGTHPIVHVEIAVIGALKPFMTRSLTNRSLVYKHTARFSRKFSRIIKPKTKRLFGSNFNIFTEYKKQPLMKIDKCGEVKLLTKFSAHHKAYLI